MVNVVNMRPRVAGLMGFSIGIGLAILFYRRFIVPILEEQKRVNQALQQKIAELEIRIHELEKDTSQNEDEHRLLKKELEEIKKGVLTQEMKNKVEELIQILDLISGRQENRRRPQHYVGIIV